MADYLAHSLGVQMISSDGPILLSVEQADQLLDIYSDAGAVHEFNRLYDAAKQHADFIPRCSSFRRIA